MLNTKKVIEDGTVLFVLEGRLDTLTAPAFEKELKESMENISVLTLDLSGVEYISSAGLRVLLFAQKIMNRQGKMTVTHVSGPIMEIFEVTGFSEILTIE